MDPGLRRDDKGRLFFSLVNPYNQEMGAQQETSLKTRWKAYKRASGEGFGALAFWGELIESGQFTASETGFLYESLNTHDKSRGVFYTPEAMARDLTERTLGRKLKNASRDEALALKILDPACGCGVFLLAAVECLRAFYGSRDYDRHIVENQLTGVDIDETAITIARLLIEHETGFEPKHVIAGNALVDSKNFVWQDEFGDTRWDVVLGNPPYVSEVRGQKELFRQLQAQSRLPVAYSAKMDLADWFVALAIEKLVPNGSLGLVLPEYWTHRSAASAMRQLLMTQGQVRELQTFGDAVQFSRAQGHHSSLLVWEKSQDEGPILINGQPGKIRQRETGTPLVYGTAAEMAVLEKIAQQRLRLSADCIQQGIVAPQTDIVVLNAPQIEALKLNAEEHAFLKPYYPVSAFSKAGFNKTATQWILYIGNKEKRFLTDCPERYPQLIAYLEQHAEKNTSSHAPYGLHRARQAHWFEAGEKILCLRQTQEPAFAVVQHDAYVGEGFYIIKPELPGWTAESLAKILNSDVAWFWFLKHKHKGSRLQVDKDVLCEFPLPENPEAGYGLTAAESRILSAALKPLLTQSLSETPAR